MRWREASWAGLSRTVSRQVLAPPPRVLPPNIRTLSPGPASPWPLLCLPGKSQIREDPSLRDRSAPSGQMVPGPDPKTGARGPGSLHRDPRSGSRRDGLTPLQGEWGQESCHNRKWTYATKACDGRGPRSPHTGERLTLQGDPCPVSPCQEGTLQVPRTWYLRVGPAVSGRAWESWPPPLGTGGAWDSGNLTDPVCRDPLFPVSREAALGSSSHHEKGDHGHHQLAVRRHIARPQGDLGKLQGQCQKKPEGPC